MERRGRIPVAKFRTQEAKSRSRSRVREPDYNEQDPETDLFTLLEDNIALKEENKTLKQEIESYKQSQDDLAAENLRLELELNELKTKQFNHDNQIKELNLKCNKLSNDRNALDKLHKMKVDIIENLNKDMELLQHKATTATNSNNSLILSTVNLKNKLLTILPTLSACSELESLVDVESPVKMPITVELVERLVDEFIALKSTFAAIELQLYEANEKVSELLEHQHQLEEDNETLRSENENLTKVAKLLTENMKESVDTSKRMEAALVKLKKRNDELVAKMRDTPDAPITQETAPASDTQTVIPVTPTIEQSSEEVENLQKEVASQNVDHNERIVEMKSLIEAAIEKTTNAELKTLQVKLEVLEGELYQAIARAELAESELEKYKYATKLTIVHSTPPTAAAAAPTPPPPPPPPLPPQFAPAVQLIGKGGQASFSDSIVAHNLRKFSGAGAGACDSGEGEDAGVSGNKIIETVKQQVQREATTGVDALVQELKSGRVTLRRRGRRKTNTNEALQEMFQVLEISQKQNRDSKICIDMNI